jgi:hypothetical protein
MAITNALDNNLIEDELLNKLTYSLMSQDPKNRTIEYTDTFTADGSTQIFQVVQNRTDLAYIKEVKQNGTALTYGEDWEIVWRELNDYGTDKFGSAYLFNTPTNGDTIEITYGVNPDGRFIYPEFPRSDLKEKSLPRIGFHMTTNSGSGGISGGKDYVGRTNILVQLKIVAKYTKRGNNIVTALRKWVTENTRNFYYFQYIRPNSVQDYQLYGKDETQSNFSKILQFEAPDRFEVVEFA